MCFYKKHGFNKDSHPSKWALVFTAFKLHQLQFTPYQKHLRYFPWFHGPLLFPNFMVYVVIHYLKGFNSPSPGHHFLNVADSVVSRPFGPRVKPLYPRHLCDFTVTLSFLNSNDLMAKPWPLKKVFGLKSVLYITYWLTQDNPKK